VTFGFLLQVGSFAEEGISGMWNADYAKILWNSGVGKSYKFQLLGWCLVISTIIMMWIKPIYCHLFAALGMIFVFIIAISFTLTGHTAEAPIWVRGALALHVVAAMWWMGSLYPLRSACNTLGGSNLQSLMVEFGKQAMFLVGLLVIAGGIISYHLEGSFSNLLDTDHGNLLLLKLGTVAVILSIAAVHKFRFVPKLSSPESIATLKRSITIEMGIGFIILVITALMSSVTGPAYG
jgi:putative copper resistance protein D